MTCPTTVTGAIWAMLSLVAAVLNSVGFYFPFWMRGSLTNITEVTFGSFRRCNYPRVTDDGRLEMVYECGRYTTFADIPSVSWQVVTITVGLGAATSFLVAFTVLASCCVSDALTSSTAKVLGLVQMAAALIIATGCAIYPNGWSSPEVRETCGGLSDAYRLGTCELSWSMYLMVAGVSLLIFCSGLSFRASSSKRHPYRI